MPPSAVASRGGAARVAQQLPAAPEQRGLVHRDLTSTTVPLGPRDVWRSGPDGFLFSFERSDLGVSRQCLPRVGVQVHRGTRVDGTDRILEHDAIEHQMGMIDHDRSTPSTLTLTPRELHPIERD